MKKSMGCWGEGMNHIIQKHEQEFKYLSGNLPLHCSNFSSSLIHGELHVSKFDCLLFICIQDGQFTFEKIQLSIQSSSPTFNISDLSFESVAGIWDRALFIRDIKWSTSCMCWECGAILSRSTTIFRDTSCYLRWCTFRWRWVTSC